MQRIVMPFVLASALTGQEVVPPRVLPTAVDLGVVRVGAVVETSVGVWWHGWWSEAMTSMR